MIVVDPKDLIRAMMRLGFHVYLSPQQARFMIDGLGHQFKFDVNKELLLELSEVEFRENPERKLFLE